MKCGAIDLEATPPPPDDDEVDRTAICELEAAEALAGMAGVPTLRLGPSQDRAKVAQRFHDCSTIPSQLCSTSYQSNSLVKPRPKLTEAEKEERKIRRILANRESARQTIRRRKAMHLELTQKAADVLEENELLKKEKELAVDEYNSLKDRNEFLKAELAKVKKAERGAQDEPTTSTSDQTCPTNTPFFMHNQPSMVPYFWPSIFPSSEVFQFQCPSTSTSESNPSHFPMLCPSMMPCSHQGQESATETNTQGPKLFVLAVPWLLPFPTHGAQSDINSGKDTAPNAHPSLPREDNHNHLSLNGNMNAPGAPPISSRPVEVIKPWRSTRVDDSRGARVAPAPESHRYDSFHKNREPLENTEDAFTATLARRRRKELMKMKNIHCYNDHLRYLAPG